jgi:predicted protein tyrosine phosphatase
MNTVNHYTDFANAEKHAKNYDAVVSLGHFLHEKFREGKKYLFLDFNDITFNQINTTGATFEDAPKESHIQEFLDFVRDLQPVDKLLVHCFAGYSRSPAGIAIAKCERDGKSLDIALQELYDARIPDKLKPRPNDVMLHQYSMIR